MKRFTGMMRGFAAAMAAAGVLSGIGTMPVMAQYNETEAQETEVPEVVKEEKPDGTPFSIAGNGELLDDITDDETKQFITVRTKNNQTFFVVIDRANKVDNVYMLSMIDENDLAEFLEDKEEETAIPQVQLPEQTGETDDETADDPGIEEEKTSGSNGMLLFAVGFIGLFAAGYYYLKLYKPKQNGGGKRDSVEQDTWNANDEDSEYDDDDAEYDDSDYEYEGNADEDESYEYDEEVDYTEDIESDSDGDYEENGSESSYLEEPEVNEEPYPYQEASNPEETDQGNNPDGQDMTEDYYDEDDEQEEPEEAKKPARRRRRRRK